MNYNPNFERDFKWYLSIRHSMSFDGNINYYNKKGQNIIIHDKNGVDGKQAFYYWDSNGIIKPTKHPNILKALLKTKASVNLHIKMYAEDRAKGVLPLMLFENICKEFNVPEWFIKAVEFQKLKYY